MVMTTVDILVLIKADQEMMKILRLAENLRLSDWLIGAGFVRNKVWDYLSGQREPTAIRDIDLIYFDRQRVDPLREKELAKRMEALTPGIEWDIKNHARMHEKNGDPPYHSSAEGLSRWVETATCVGVKLQEGQLELVAPHGIEDLVNLVVRPSPKYLDNLAAYRERQRQKNWSAKWPKLTFYNLD
jgi:hypothetical protein